MSNQCQIIITFLVITKTLTFAVMIVNQSEYVSDKSHFYFYYLFYCI